jgi:hypothetical protein
MLRIDSAALRRYAKSLVRKRLELARDALAHAGTPAT